MAEEYDECGNIDEVFRNDDRGAHKDFEVLFLHSTRVVQGKPSLTEKGATSAVSKGQMRLYKALTLCHRASYDKLSAEGSRGPSILGHRSTTLILVSAW